MALDGSLVIGIDLGTTNSCAFYYIDGKLEILENRDGGRLTPSYVFFTPSNTVLVGQYAKSMADQKPENGIFEMKRLIGRDFDDEILQEKMRHLPFTIQNVEGKPVIEINLENEVRYETPRELSAKVLTNIKKDVEDKLGFAISKAVITVPAYFSTGQRQETLEAAKRAGFVVLKLLNEPNAAALNYFFEPKNAADDGEEQLSLIYDLGGGTFDVAILRKTNEIVEVISVDGDTQLGGHDFDNLITDYVRTELQRLYEFDPKGDRRKMRRLNGKCEEVKKMLSRNKDTLLVLEAFVPGHDVVTLSFARTQLEGLIQEMLQRTIDITDRCVRNANIDDKALITQVILAGGSTRIPKVQSLLSEYFARESLCKLIHPDECVAKGAALQAAMLSQNPRQKIDDIQIVDVVPLSLGWKTFGHGMEHVIRKNSKIPASGTGEASNASPDTRAIFQIFEGERSDTRKNRFLGQLTLHLTPLPPLQCKITIQMDVDSNGILTISAREEFSGNAKDIEIEFYTRGLRSDGEVRKAIEDAEKYKEEDAKFKELCSLKYYLHFYCEITMHNLREKNVVCENQDVYDRCEIISLLAEDLEEKNARALSLVQEVREKCGPLYLKYGFDSAPNSKSWADHFHVHFY